jgi:hypothetical protein
MSLSSSFLFLNRITGSVAVVVVAVVVLAVVMALVLLLLFPSVFGLLLLFFVAGGALALSPAAAAAGVPTRGTSYWGHPPRVERTSWPELQPGVTACLLRQPLSLSAERSLGVKSSSFFQ